MVCFVPGCVSITFKDIKQHTKEAHIALYHDLMKRKSAEPLNGQVSNQQLYTQEPVEVSSTIDEEDNDPQILLENDEPDRYHNVPKDDDPPSKLVARAMTEMMLTKEENLINDSQFRKLATCIITEVVVLRKVQNFDYILEQLLNVCSSSWNTKKFITETFNYCPPMRQIISGDEVYRVPINSIVQQMLTCESVVEQFKSAHSYKPNDQGLITCFRDTESFKTETQTLFSEIQGRDDVLVIFGELYADGFTITNPIGPFKSSSNVTGVYLNFSYLKRKDRMKREDQKLVAIIPTESVEDSGYKSQQ